MEPDWNIVLIMIGSSISLIVFLIWRNQKDKKALMGKLIDEDELSVPKTHETEDDT